ncbi:aminopeptidase [Paenibacillus lautus]|uniref:aminopeptidase n=1 Tax=Paenibacillus lautus TaxID=1401 RepID=UPI003D29C501
MENYAELAVKVGVNVQPGQTVVVMGPIAAADLIRLITLHVYKAGAHNVHVEYNDDQLSKIKYLHAPEEVGGKLSTFLCVESTSIDVFLKSFHSLKLHY